MSNLFLPTAQTCQVIRHVPLDVTGHGYRSIGLSKLTNSSAGWQSELVDWIVHDACIATCVEDIHASCAEGLVLNPTSFLQSLPPSAPGKINEGQHEECLHRALPIDASKCAARL